MQFPVTMVIAVGVAMCITQRGIVHALKRRDALEYLAKYLEIKFKVIENRGLESEILVTLKNSGNRTIFTEDTGQFSLQFCSIRKITTEYTEASRVGDLDTWIPEAGSDQSQRPAEITNSTSANRVRVMFLNGCSHSLTTLSGFTLKPGIRSSFSLISQYWMVARTDVMPNWYVHHDNASRVLRSTQDTLDFVEKFTSPASYKRQPTDKYAPFSPEHRLFRTLDQFDPFNHSTGDIPVIPSVKEYSLTGCHVALSQRWKVVDDLDSEFNDLLVYATENLGIGSVSPNKRNEKYLVILNVDESSPMYTDEHYTLSISDEVIKAVARSEAGLFYAIQTLVNLMTIRHGDRIQYTTAKCSEISDGPRFAYRGFMVDIARNFFPLPCLMRLVNQMATYKLNVLHLHLSDDEGFRLQIEGIPELTEVGSRSCGDGDDCLSPRQLGETDSTSDSRRYLTSGEYKQLLMEAKRLQVKVIPEFDMPGHARAAILSMRQRNKRCQAEGCTLDLNLEDPDDTSVYESIQMFTDNAMNPCLESTYTFIRKLMTSVLGYHNEVTSDPVTFNFGGDEVAHNAWLDSPVCRQMGFNESKPIKMYFLQRIDELAKEVGVKLQAWEDGFMNTENVATEDLLQLNTTSVVWQNIWEWGGGSKAYKMANAGYKVVLGHATHLYFDHPQEPDPEERGYYWATRFTDLHKIFSYCPDDIYRNINDTRFGTIINKTALCSNNQCPALEKRENIIGIQGSVWSETVRTDQDLQEMVWPRIFALAERAWHKADWEDQYQPDNGDYRLKDDYNRFINIIGKIELPRMAAAGNRFRVYPPGAVCTPNALVVGVQFENLQVECKDTEGTSWSIVGSGLIDWKDVRQCRSTTGNYVLRTGSKLFAWKSREIVLTCNSIGSSSNIVNSSISLCLVVLFMNLIFRN